MLDALLAPPPSAPADGLGAPADDTSHIRLPGRDPFEDTLAAHDRIGFLADVVVRRVFAAGLELDAVRSMTTDASVRARLLRISNLLDELIAHVRSAALGRDA